MRKLFSIQRLIKSFGYALRGLSYIFRTEPNAQIHLLAVAVTTVAGVYFNISGLEWTLQIMIICAVIAAELFNSALEEILDKLHPEQHPQIGLAKDLAAAAVLVLAIGALCVAWFIYADKVEAMIG